jgi:hypothetical protein
LVSGHESSYASFPLRKEENCFSLKRKREKETFSFRTRKFLCFFSLKKRRELRFFEKKAGERNFWFRDMKVLLLLFF